MNNLAKFISLIFHPLLFATYLFLLFYWLYPAALLPVQGKFFSRIILLIFFTTFVLPVANIYFLKTFGSLQSVAMPGRKERIVPFLMIAILHGMITYFLYAKTGINWADNFMKFLLIINALILVSFLFTLFVKISIHALSISGMVGILLVLNNTVENGVFFYPMLAAIIMAGFVMMARLQLQAHTTREISLGAMIGMMVSVGGMLLLF